MRNLFFLVFLTFFLSFSLICVGASAQESAGALVLPAEAGATSDENAILGTLDRFFAASKAGDVDTATTILIPEGVLFAQQVGDDGAGVLRHQTNLEWLDNLRRRSRIVDERTSSSVVSVRGSIAVVWQSYIVDVDGRFSYCGVNIVSMVRVDGAWRIASLVWTVERSDCPA